MRFFLLACMLFATILHLPDVVRAGVVSGIVVLPSGAFDFSEQTSPAFALDPSADILAAYVVDPIEGFFVNARFGATIAALPGVDYADLAEAPSDSSLYTDFIVPAAYNVTYVVKTQEGHYAKFRFVSLVAAIEYSYQPNGSRILVDATPAKAISWGQLKAIYFRRDL